MKLVQIALVCEQNNVCQRKKKLFKAVSIILKIMFKHIHINIS